MQVTVDQPRPRRRRRCTSCRSFGRATSGRGARGSKRPVLAAHGTNSVAADHPHAAADAARLRRRARAAVLRQRHQCRTGIFGIDGDRATSRTGSTITSSTATATAVNPARIGTKVAAHYQADGSRRRRRRSSACASRRDRRRASTISTRSFAAPAPRPTSSTPRCSRASPTPTRAWCSARPSPGCCGRSSIYHLDIRALAARRPAAAAAARGRGCTAATPIGGISTTPTSSRCRTSGNTRGTPPGTSRSTA